jgi:uncharacterized protein (TIRG00374 family)
MARGPRGAIVIAAIVVVAAVAALMVSGELRGVGDRLGAFAWPYAAAATGLALVNYAIRYARWSYYLRRQAIDVPVGARASVFVAGLSLSMTPGKVGELVKSYLLREMHDVAVTRSAPVVIAERLTDLVAIVALAVIGAAAYGLERGAAIAAAAVVVAGGIVLAWPAVARAVIRVVTAPPGLRRLRDRVLEIYDGIRELCRPAPLATATALGIAGWLGECIGFAVVVHGFPGASIDVGLAMLIYAITTLAGALSFVPGGLGVTEGAMTLLLVQTAVGLDQPTAIAAAVVFRVATLWVSVGLGLAGLAWARQRIAARPVRAAGPT